MDNFIYKSFKIFGYIMLIEGIFSLIGGLDLIEFYVNIIQISFALIIIYLFFQVNKSLEDKNLKNFTISYFLARVGTLIVYLINKLIFEIYFSSDEMFFFKFGLSFVFSFAIFLLFLYAWDCFKKFFVAGTAKFPERYDYHGLGGAKNLFLGYILMLLGTLLTIILIGIFILFIGIIFVLVGYLRLAYFITIKDFEELTTERSHIGKVT